MDEYNAIGVIGGMGPYAGVDLVKKIFDQTTASTDQEHLPVVLISYPSRVPDRSAYLADRAAAPSPIPALTDILGRLEQAGCSVAGMPCNTAHAPVIFEPLLEWIEQERKTIRLLNMIETSAAAVRERAPGARQVGVIATNATIRTELYQAALAQLGIEAVVPAADIQEGVVTPLIFDTDWGIKARSNPPSEAARRGLLETVAHLSARTVDAVILGCTELPLALPEREIAGVPLIDSTLSLARAMIRATYTKRLRPAT